MTDVFGVNADQAEPEVQPEPANYLDQFKTEGQSIEEIAENLAKKAVNADKFIETLKNEKTALQASFEELNVKVRTTDELMAAIAQAPPVESFSEPTAPEVDYAPVAPSLTEEDVEAKVRQALMAKEEEQRVNQKFWGDMKQGLGCDEKEARAKVLAYTGDDDGKKQVVSMLGATDPSALVRIISDVGPESFTEEPGVPAPRTGPPTGNGLTWSECKQLKKDNPTKFKSPVFQKAKFEAIQNNPNFYNS